MTPAHASPPLHRRGFDPSWRLDETYVKVRGKWTYLYRAVDKRGDTIDFQGDVILWAVRWYCRYPISYRDLEEMLGSVAKIVKLEHAWRRLDGRNDDGFQVAPFPSPRVTSKP